MDDEDTRVIGVGDCDEILPVVIGEEKFSESIKMAWGSEVWMLKERVGRWVVEANKAINIQYDEKVEIRRTSA